MKTSVLITGPESSCTRMVTQIVCSMRFIGSSGHLQVLDKYIGKSPIVSAEYVYRQSVPHGGRLPDYKKIRKYFKNNNMDLRTIVVLRNHIPNMISKVERGHTENKNVNKKLSDEISYIFKNSIYIEPFIVLSASALMLDVDSGIFEIERFLEKKFTGKKSFIFNSDKKRYEDVHGS